MMQAFAASIDRQIPCALWIVRHAQHEASPFVLGHFDDGPQHARLQAAYGARSQHALAAEVLLDDCHPRFATFDVEKPAAIGCTNSENWAGALGSRGTTG